MAASMQYIKWGYVSLSPCYIRYDFNFVIILEAEYLNSGVLNNWHQCILLNNRPPICQQGHRMHRATARIRVPYLGSSLGWLVQAQNRQCKTNQVCRDMTVGVCTRFHPSTCEFCITVPTPTEATLTGLNFSAGIASMFNRKVHLPT